MTALRCSPGDLAVVVQARNKSNIGKIVRILKKHINEPEWNFRERPAWLCRSASSVVWYFASTKSFIRGVEGPIPDDCLQPIRPPSESAQVYLMRERGCLTHSLRMLSLDDLSFEDDDLVKLLKPKRYSQVLNLENDSRIAR